MADYDNKYGSNFNYKDHKLVIHVHYYLNHTHSNTKRIILSKTIKIATSYSLLLSSTIFKRSSSS